VYAPVRASETFRSRNVRGLATADTFATSLPVRMLDTLMLPGVPSSMSCSGSGVCGIHTLSVASLPCENSEHGSGLSRAAAREMAEHELRAPLQPALKCAASAMGS